VFPKFARQLAIMVVKEPLEELEEMALMIVPEVTKDYFDFMYFAIIGLCELQFKQFYQVVLSSRHYKYWRARHGLVSDLQ
jgi:hypothetical protein